MQPILERRTPGNREALHEIADGQIRHSLPILLRRQTLELLEIEANRVGRQADLIPLALQAFRTEMFAQNAHRLVQRVARRRIRLIAPEQPDEVVSRARSFRGAGKVDQQRQVLAPKQFRWRRIAVDQELDGAEHSAAYHVSPRCNCTQLAQFGKAAGDDAVQDERHHRDGEAGREEAAIERNDRLRLILDAAEIR